MQKDSKLLDDMAKMATGAMGGLLEARREMEAFATAQAEKILARMRLVTREEYEASQAMLAKAREEQEELKLRLSLAEEKLVNLEQSIQKEKP